eukprot:GEMP01019862.1.p1 GENE.GEMP01019862.1~~GEMP01019862.1.p1  ORF type:complete len:202 (+),score=27.45 GEMP01019862.1:152-757(+)
MMYIIITVFIAFLILADVALIIVPFIMVHRSVSGDSPLTALMLLGVLAVLSISAGYFAMIVYFHFETKFQPPPNLPRLEDLPLDPEYFNSEDELSDDSDLDGELQGMGAEKKGVTTKLTEEIKKMVLTTDRMSMCERFCKKLPKDAYVSKAEVDDILRLFTDPEDGIAILNMFEQRMQNKESQKEANKEKKSAKKKNKSKI